MAKQIEYQPEQAQITLWAWLLRLLSTPFLVHWLPSLLPRSFDKQPLAGLTEPQANAISLASHHTPRPLLLSHLPGALMGNILSYLMPRDIQSVLYLNSACYRELKFTKTLNYLEQQQRLKKFCHLVAIEGEDNQTKAQAMLIHANSAQSRAMLLLERTTIQDAAGRIFKELSAYAYAFWSGDTRMRKMMGQYMDEKLKAKAYEECKAIVDKGIQFTFKGKTITQSRHFDFQPLLKAYQDYAVALTESELGNWHMYGLMQLKQYLFHIGQEQAKVPVHIAQEFCSHRPFHPLPTFQSADDFLRTLRFHHVTTNRFESWSFAGAMEAMVYKGAGSFASGGGVSSVDTHSAVLDEIALKALCQARVHDDLGQTLEELKPAAQRFQFIP
ncbi:MAG: hypothetical protein CK426_00230 [Legionella sp.]|nr:MAG: hypothetical protein CK423_06310 [Legionella sp.]PJE00181.1 MAG: hypothetical protein CK426_00230 [Legionella sp.]